MNDEQTNGAVIIKEEEVLARYTIIELRKMNLLLTAISLLHSLQFALILAHVLIDI